MNGKQSSNGMKVRDMVRRYDTALNSESVKSSYSSIGKSKSSYFGLNAHTLLPDEDFEDLYADEKSVQGSVGSPSRSSNGSQKTLRKSLSPRFEDFNDIPLDTQKSFMNLSRSRCREPPRPAPRGIKIRQSSCELETQPKDGKLSNVYQSKTTISKTPNGVRIAVDIFFDQNKGLTIEDVVRSRIETDIPPSKILNEFQRRIGETSQD